MPLATAGALAPEEPAVGDLLPAPPVEEGVWDELRLPNGVPRPIWSRFLGLLPAPSAGLGPTADLDRRLAQIHEQIQRDGVTHNVFGADGVATRPWSLELLPLLIEPKDWAEIEPGLVQRAELLEAVLADLYGARQLLHKGLLPPALLLRHPGYVRAMHGARPAGGQRLLIVAFDIARGPDGGWWVVAQRTQGPPGLGYVLHNRLLVSAQFPDIFREMRVQHIASSYQRLLNALEGPAREAAGGHTPRIVLLTPGPYSETWFEQAYLARYLGLPLVEGGDLTVRGERLYLKTVEGLEPVHGVLRRVDDDWCDPLVLRPDSALGVPGLVDAARAGHIVMANALGSAFLESPAIQGFLPGIARQILGQKLLMPSLPTWWCGEPAAWADVKGRLEGKLLRSTFPEAGRTSKVFAPDQAGVDLDPDAWTVQSRLSFSRAPIWDDGTLTPRPALLRVYAIADGQGRWQLLPGGMTRVAKGAEASVSMQRGGTSLDTWVLTDGPVDHFSLLPGRLSVDDVQGRRRPVSSRTGENLFWLGRYTERTEHLVRLARATLRLTATDGMTRGALPRALSMQGGRAGLVPPGVPPLVKAPRLYERALLAGLADDKDAFSIAFYLGSLERTSHALRDRLSPEQWGLIRTMRASFTSSLALSGGDLPARARVPPALDRLALQLAAATGAQSDRMIRDHGWRFLTVGRLLERLVGLTQCLDDFLEAGALGGADGVEALLDLFDSTITYRARYQRHEDLLALVDLLVLDDTNPRAFAGVLRRLRTELAKLPGILAPMQSWLPRAGVGFALRDLRDLDDAGLVKILLEVARRLNRLALSLGEEIGHRYFALADGPDQVRHT
ncbi:MAG: circularly permuted type 2 ATP-grasp protein [Chromatiaceae bacterium]